MKELRFQPSKHRQSAFTLIELLIVVAIIGILASIAVPNFLGALTKAKTAKSQAEMRSLITAVEAYRVDWNRYPFPADEEGEPIPFDQPSVFWFETKTTPVLTEPTAYISSLPADPYRALGGEEEEHEDEHEHGGGEDAFYHYYTRRYVEKSTGSAQGFQAYLQLIGIQSEGLPFLLLGHGPDGDHDAPGEGFPARYDVSNGIISNGDIIQF